MAAPDDGRLDQRDGGPEGASGARRDDGAQELSSTGEHPLASVKQNVDRVADKVKALLRSGR